MTTMMPNGQPQSSLVWWDYLQKINVDALFE